MKVRLTRRALRQLDQARDYIASDNPAARAAWSSVSRPQSDDWRIIRKWDGPVA